MIFAQPSSPPLSQAEGLRERRGFFHWDARFLQSLIPYRNGYRQDKNCPVSTKTTLTYFNNP
jgi:hypothetical protein